MALLSKLVDQRTFAGLTIGQSTSFAHGLGLNASAQSAQIVCIVALSSVFAASSASLAIIGVAFDATNVTLSNGGEITGPSMIVTTMWLHALIQ